MEYRREAMIMAVALVAACCIVGSALYLSSDRGGRGDGAVTDDDYIGCWYLVQTVRSESDGAIIDVSVGDSGDAFLSDRCLHIFGVDSGLVHGMYHDDGITGYVLDDLVQLYFEKHGNYTQFTGYLRDGFLVLSSAHSDLDADGDVTALCAGIFVYSKDPARPLMDMSGMSPDLSGEWKVGSSRVVTESYTRESDVVGMVIDWTKNGVFTGSVTLDKDGVTRTVAVKGSIAPCGSGYSGMMSEMDYSGAWGVTYRDGILRIATSDTRSMHGQAGGEEVVFTRDGSNPPMIFIPSSAVDTSWITISSRTIDVDGELSSDGNEYVLDFDEQTGDLVHATSAYGTRSANVYVYYLCDAGDGKHRLQVSWDAFHSPLALGTGMYADGKIHFLECYVSEDGTPVTSVMVLEERKATPDVDILGHWYACYSVGYDSVSGYTESGYSDSPHLAMYDIDVLKYDDGLIYGEYMGDSISAAYADGFVSMDMVYPGGGTIKTVRGWFDNNVMVLVVGITDTGGSGDLPFSVYYAAYSKVRAPVTLNTPETDLSGSWMSESHTEFLMDGELRDLGSVDLEINDVRKNVFTGTLGAQKYGGIYLNVYGGIAGIIADSLGRQWYVTSYDGESIRANTIDADMIGEGTIGDICTVFVRDGSHGSIDVPDMSGETYVSSGLRMQYSDGGSFKIEVPITLIIDDQNGNCIIGRCTMGDSEYAVIGSVFWINGVLAARISLQSGPDPYEMPLGYLTFRDGSVTLSMHSMTEGLSATSIAEMTEVVS